jgi:malate dehydrogenase (oxaloacetate-decarboxylating)(NADP+)
METPAMMHTPAQAGNGRAHASCTHETMQTPHERAHRRSSGLEKQRNALERLEDARTTKDTAFSEEERKKLRLEGLLPHAVESIDRQLERVLGHLANKPSDLEQYIYLMDLCDRNETLFYKTLMSDPARFVPIVYDPTIADACLTFGHIYRRPRGMYITRAMQGRMADVLRNWPRRDVRVICVTSGGRILGLGDIGTNGMPIPIGKLQLYTACAGVPPDALLPMMFDIGTTNDALRADPLYLGLREEPPPPAVIDALVDELVQAVQAVFPGCCIHFEDWKGEDALRLLARYEDKVLCYNDDVQGTASVTIAGLETALQIIGGRLRDQRVFFLGAGSAGIGIADMIVEAMVIEGLTRQEAQERITLFDVNGLIERSRADLDPSQKVYAKDAAPTRDLEAAIAAAKPSVLVGVSTKGGAFTQKVIETMARLNERPIIFPLSNPTDHAECTPEQAYAWTKGKALVACGVQFPEVTLEGKTYRPGQANNFYIFPAVGLAVYATRPTRLDDPVFVAAARALADQVDSEDRARGMLFPSQTNILETEVTTATRVAEHLFDRGMATVPRPDDIRGWIEGMLYRPVYR